MTAEKTIAAPHPDADSIRRYELLGCFLPLGLILAGIVLVILAALYGYGENPDNATAAAWVYGICSALVALPLSLFASGIVSSRLSFKRARLASNRGATDLPDDGTLHHCPHCGHVDRPVEPGVCVNCGKHRDDNLLVAKGDASELERQLLDFGVGGGSLLMVVSVIWFVGGYLAGRIFYYPPILFLVGLIAAVRGIVARRRSNNEANPK